jgi:hypothetical protein
MTDPIGRDGPPRSTGEKAAFVVIAGVLWALIIAMDDFIQSHETRAVAMYMWQPGSLFRLNPVLETLRNLATYGFMIVAPILYRDRFTGLRWVVDTFVAMLAIYAIGFCILAPLYHTIHYAAGTLSWLGLGVVVCVLCSIFSVFWAWIFTAGVVRMRPNTRTPR